MKLTLVIQAGGKSQRMGDDKALLDFDGLPLIQHIYDRLSPIADQVLITANHSGYDFLKVPIVPDVIPSRGAIGGLYTALEAAAHPLVAIVACDMPFANPQLFTYQARILADENFDAVIPVSPDGLEPFHGVYRKEACQPSLRSALQADEWRIRPWLERLNLRRLSSVECAPFDPERRAFTNINSTDELSALKRVRLIIGQF